MLITGSALRSHLALKRWKTTASPKYKEENVPWVQNFPLCKKSQGEHLCVWWHLQTTNVFWLVLKGSFNEIHLGVCEEPVVSRPALQTEPNWPEDWINTIMKSTSSNKMHRPQTEILHESYLAATHGCKHRILHRKTDQVQCSSHLKMLSDKPWRPDGWKHWWYFWVKPWPFLPFPEKTQTNRIWNTWGTHWLLYGDGSVSLSSESKLPARYCKDRKHNHNVIVRSTSSSNVQFSDSENCAKLDNMGWYLAKNGGWGRTFKKTSREVISLSRTMCAHLHWSHRWRL